MEPCPRLPRPAYSLPYQKTKDRVQFLNSLQAGHWVSCRYSSTSGKVGHLGRFYNALVLHLERDESGTLATARLRWFSGDEEDGVARNRLQPVHLYAVGDT